VSGEWLIKVNDAMGHMAHGNIEVGQVTNKDVKSEPMICMLIQRPVNEPRHSRKARLAEFDIQHGYRCLFLEEEVYT